MTRKSSRKHKIIKRCKKGDQKAQFELYQNYVDSIYNIAMRFFNNKMDAEDIVQETFIQAFKQIGTLKDENAFGGWLKRITTNKSISELRKRKIIFDNIDETAYNTDYDDNINESIDPKLVNDAIKELPVPFRTIVNLHVFGGKKHKEISEILNITESTSKARYRKAKSLLANKLKHLLIDPQEGKFIIEPNKSSID